MADQAIGLSRLVVGIGEFDYFHDVTRYGDIFREAAIGSDVLQSKLMGIAIAAALAEGFKGREVTDRKIKFNLERMAGAIKARSTTRAVGVLQSFKEEIAQGYEVAVNNFKRSRSVETLSAPILREEDNITFIQKQFKKRATESLPESVQKELDDYAGWQVIADEYELPTRVITGDEFTAQLGDAASQWVGGLYTDNDGRAEPHKATPAIARAAIRNGADIMTACTVRGLETEAGKVSAVVTEHGTIRTSTVLCAAGAWSSLFCRSLGISLPQLQVRGTVARTAPTNSSVRGAFFEDRIGIRPRQDGGYTVAHGTILDHQISPDTFRYSYKFLRALIHEFRSLRVSIGKDFFDELRIPSHWPLDGKSPFEKMRVLNPKPNPKILASIRRNLVSLFPEFANVELVESWAGMVETSPDVVPIICAEEKLPGFYIATGFSGHGFGIGPGAGKAVAAMLTGNDVGIDLSAFKLSRFFDGSPIRLVSSI